MRKFSLCSLVAAFLVLLTSCLGDGNSSQTMSFSTVGVVTLSSKTGKIIVRTSNAGDIYNEAFGKSFVPGDCLQLNCSYDSSNPNNANDYANGYMYVTLTSEPVSVDKGTFRPTATDTTQLVDPNEFVLEDAIKGDNSVAYAGGYLFMTSTYQGLTNQQNEWQLYYDMNQKPLEQSGINTYTFVLRAVKKADGKSPKGLQGDLNAYQAKSVLDQLNSKEYANGKDRFRVRFRYLKSIGEKDSTLTWAYSKELDYPTTKE